MAWWQSLLAIVATAVGLGVGSHQAVAYVGSAAAEQYFDEKAMPVIEQRVDEKIEYHNTQQTLEIERLINQLRLEIERLKLIQ
jgi:hypothetical protein